MFSQIFIDRPKFAMVLSIVTVLAGVICMTKLPVAEYPEVAPPTIMVFANYPGASAQVIAETIAAPIESQMNGLEDLQYFSSKSDDNGSYMLTITFKSGTDTNIALVNTQNAVKRVEPTLPNEVVSLGIDIRKRSSDILGSFAFSVTKDCELDLLGLNNYLKTNIQDEISRIDGVSEASVFGTGEYSMRIWLDTMKMTALGIKPDDIATAVRSQNVQAAAGSVGAESANEYLQMKVTALGRLKTTEEFENIVVKTGEDGRIVLMKDIARIELGAESYSYSSMLDGKPSIAMMIYRNDDANAVNVVDTVKAKLAELSKNFPKGIEYDMVYDTTKYIRNTMEEIFVTILVTLLLVVGITYVFLQDWRATLIPGLAVPVSMFGTFILLLPLGFTINLLTMFALILVIGSLVDDAIVVVENVTRLIDEEGLSPYDATVKSMHQITNPVIATTLVILAIYTPIAFYGGMVGVIYLQFAVTMCIALCFSTFNALTLSPALCAMILRPKNPNANTKRFNIFTPFNVILDKSRGIFLFCASIFVRRGILTLIVLGIVLSLNYFMYTRMPGEFLPPEDKGAILGFVELQPGATLRRTQNVMINMNEKIGSIPGVSHVLTISGFSMAGTGENLGFSIVTLDDWEDRTTEELSLDSIKAQAEAKLIDIPSARINFFNPPPIMGLGATGGVTLMLQAIEGQSPQQLAMALGKLLVELNQSPKTTMAYSSYNAATPQLFMDIDREKAESLNVPISRIFSTLQSNLASLYINDFNLYGYTFKVKMQAEGEERSIITDISHINVQSNSGEMIPISALANIRYIVGPRMIQRFNQYTSADINAQAAPKVSSGELMNLIEKVVNEINENSDQYGGKYSIAWTDMSFQERMNEGKVVTLMLLALIFAYLFLVAQYESWTIPIPVMTSVSVATLGAFIGLRIWEKPLSIYAQMGLIMLIGLASKNSILMVEFSKQERERGLSIYEAAMNGGRIRYRAVLMTAWSFIIGVLPMAFATGAGAGSRTAIGITTFAGMLLATAVGIVLIPPLYAVFQRMREFVNPMKIKDTESTEKV